MDIEDWEQGGCTQGFDAGTQVETVRFFLDIVCLFLQFNTQVQHVVVVENVNISQVKVEVLTGKQR